MKASVVVGLMVALLVAAFFFGKSQSRSTTTIEYDTVTVVKEVQLEKIVYRNLPAKLDTVWRTLHDTLQIPVEVATIDTVLEPYKDFLSISYLFPPVNSFDLMFMPGPRPVEVHDIVKTVTVYEKQSWFVDALYVAGGLGAGFAIGQITR